MLNADDVKRWQAGNFENGPAHWNENVKMSFAKALGADFAAEALKLQECWNLQRAVCMHRIAAELDPDLLGEIANLTRGPAMTST
jgi:hypothetical protein